MTAGGKVTEVLDRLWLVRRTPKNLMRAKDQRLLLAFLPLKTIVYMPGKGSVREFLRLLIASAGERFSHFKTVAEATLNFSLQCSSGAQIQP